MSAPRESSHRLPSIDGWRAVAILLVLGHHAQYSYGFPPRLVESFDLFDGPLGVSFFFTVSGFLITWLLLEENRREGRVRLSAFYIRRALRILPVYGVFLGALLVLQCLTKFRQSPRVWLANITFTTNFLGTAPWPSSHLWSLAVEEQFYLLWPGLLVVFGLAENLRRALLVLLVPIVGAPLVRILTYLHTHAGSRHLDLPIASFVLAQYSFFNYADQLAVGCVAALLLKHRRPLVEAWLGRNRIGRSVTAVLMVVVPHALSRRYLLGPLLVPFGCTCQSLGFVFLLLQSILHPTEVLYRILNRRFLVQIGVLSYSIYVWQQIFSAPPALFGWRAPIWMTFPLWPFVAVLWAGASFYLLERPLFRLRSRFR